MLGFLWISEWWEVYDLLGFFWLDFADGLGRLNIEKCSIRKKGKIRAIDKVKIVFNSFRLNRQ